jgi:hypothetical protein
MNLDCVLPGYAPEEERNLNCHRHEDLKFNIIILLVSYIYFQRKSFITLKYDCGSERNHIVERVKLCLL